MKRGENNMGAKESDILNSIADKTQSDLILFFIIMTVVLVAVLLPLYAMVMKDRKEKHAAENIRQDKYIEREKEIIKVITANTEVMSGLKATLESSGAATNSSLARIHERIDGQSGRIHEMGTAMTQLKASLDRSISNQSAMIDGINRVLLIVDSLPHESHFGKGGKFHEQKSTDTEI